MQNSIFKDWTVSKWLLNIVLIAVCVYALSYSVNFIFAIGYVIMLIVHEIGHIIAALNYRCEVRFGGFTPFGAYIQIYNHTSTKQTAIIALCGPFFGFLTSLGFLGLAYLLQDTTYLWLCFFAAVVSTMNLMPLHPFDGGKVICGTFPTFPLILIPLLGYGVYLTYKSEPDMSYLYITLIVYVIWNVWKMKKDSKYKALFRLDKAMNLQIFAFYIAMIVLLIGLIVVLLETFGNTLWPNVQEMKIPDFLQGFF